MEMNSKKKGPATLKPTKLVLSNMPRSSCGTKRVCAKRQLRDRDAPTEYKAMNTPVAMLLELQPTPKNKKNVFFKKNGVILSRNIADKVFPTDHFVRWSHSINFNSQLHFQILRLDFLKKIIFTLLCTTFYN